MELIEFLSELKQNKHLTLNHLQYDIQKLKNIVDSPNLKFDVKPNKKLKNYITDLKSSVKSSVINIRDSAVKSFRAVSDIMPTFKPKYKNDDISDDVYLLLGFLLSIDNFDDFSFDDLPFDDLPFENEDDILALIGLLMIDQDMIDQDMIDQDDIKLVGTLQEIIHDIGYEPNEDQPRMDTITSITSYFQKFKAKATLQLETLKRNMQREIDNANMVARINEELHSTTVENRNRLQTELEATQALLRASQTESDRLLQEAEARTLAALQGEREAHDRVVSNTEELLRAQENLKDLAAASQADIEQLQTTNNSTIKQIENNYRDRITRLITEDEAEIADLRDRHEAELAAARSQADDTINTFRATAAAKIADALRSVKEAEIKSTKAYEDASLKAAESAKARAEADAARASASEAEAALAQATAQHELSKSTLQTAHAAQIAFYTTQTSALSETHKKLEEELEKARERLDECKDELEKALAAAEKTGQEAKGLISTTKEIMESEKRSQNADSQALINAANEAKKAAEDRAHAAQENADQAAIMLQAAEVSLATAEEAARIALSEKENAEKRTREFEERTRQATSSQKDAEIIADIANKEKDAATIALKKSEDDLAKANIANSEALAAVQKELSEIKANFEKVVQEKSVLSQQIESELQKYKNDVTALNTKIEKLTQGQLSVSSINMELGEEIARLNNLVDRQKIGFRTLLDDYKLFEQKYKEQTKKMESAITSLRGQKQRADVLQDTTVEFRRQLESREQEIKDLRADLETYGTAYAVAIVESELNQADSNASTELLRNALSLLPKDILRKARHDSVGRKMGDRWQKLHLDLDSNSQSGAVLNPILDKRRDYPRPARSFDYDAPDAPPIPPSPPIPLARSSAPPIPLDRPDRSLAPPLANPPPPPNLALSNDALPRPPDIRSPSLNRLPPSEDLWGMIGKSVISSPRVVSPDLLPSETQIKMRPSPSKKKNTSSTRPTLPGQSYTPVVKDPKDGYSI